MDKSKTAWMRKKRVAGEYRLLSRLFHIFIMSALLVTLTSCGEDEITDEDGGRVTGRDDIRPIPTPPPVGTPDPGTGTPVWITSVLSRLSNGYYPPGTELLVDITFSSPLKVIGPGELDFEIRGNRITGSIVPRNGYHNVHQVRVILPTIGLGGKLCLVRDPVIRARGSSYSGGDINWNVPKGSFCPRHAIILSRSDTFNEGSISSQWTTYDNDEWDQDGDGIVNNEPEMTFLLENGELIMATQGKGLRKNDHFFSSLYMNDLQGDFDMVIEVRSMVREEKYTQAGFILSNDIENLHQGGNFLCSVSANNGVMIGFSSKGNGNLNRRQFDGQSLFPVWLRMKKLGRYIYCYYRYDQNTAWTLHSKGRKGINVDSVYDVGLFSATDQGKPGEFVFDNFSFLD